MIRYDFRISDLLIRVETPRKLQIPDNFKPFLTDNSPLCEPDFLLQIVFSTTPATSGADVRQLSECHTLSNFQNLVKFRWRDGEYIIRQETAGRDQPCRLFIPPSFADIFCERGKWLNYLAMEQILLPYHAVILHAAAVIHQGKAYLFSAPSGTGKSTHVGLWQKHYGATILNGDKVILRRTPEGLIAYGSPVAGSSEIYVNESAPVAAIFLLRQAKHNRVIPVTNRNAVLAMYSESVKSIRDPEFNARLLDEIVLMQKQLPILTLECLPEKGAVDCILQYIERMKL